MFFLVASFGVVQPIGSFQGAVGNVLSVVSPAPK